MRPGTKRIGRWALTLLLIMAVPELHAQSDVATYREELAKRDRQIAELRQRYEDLERRVRQFEVAALDALASSQASDALPQDVLPEAADRLQSDDPTEQNRLIRSAFENTLIDRGGLLLPAWSYNLEPSLNYIHSSSENIVIDGFTIFPILIIGDIVSEKLTRDINILNLTFRLGLPWDSQAEIRIPYGHQKLRTASANGEQRELNDNGLGDIELTFAHQLYKSAGKWPDVVANLRWKSITGANPFTAPEGDIFVGTGYHATSLSFNAVKVIDPVVYFAGLGYTHNNRTAEEIGNFDPGDSWGVNLGMAIALNLNNSLSFAYDQQFTKKSRLDGESIPSSHSSTGVFSIGTSFLITDHFTVDFSLGIGVTEDSPDLLLRTSFPLRGSF